MCEKELASGHLPALFGRGRERGSHIGPGANCRDARSRSELLPAYAVRRKNVVGREGPKRQHIVGGLA